MEKDPVINWISIISVFLCSFNSEIGLYLDAERALSQVCKKWSIKSTSTSQLLQII